MTPDAFVLLKSACLAGCLVLTLGCTTPYSTPERNPSDARFPGLAQLGGMVPAGAPLDVLSVHGMCTHDEKWVDGVAAQFADHLALNRTPPENIDDVQGVQIWLTRLFDADGGVAIRHYALVWSPLTEVQKQTLCYDASTSSASCTEPGFAGKRAKINGSVKSLLLNDCFADAVIYLGPRGQVIRDALRAAVERFGTERTADGPLVVVTESLGSKVLTDAIVQAPSAERARSLAALRNTRAIFMAANQIPLLNLGYQGSVEVATRAATVEDLRTEIRRLDSGPQARDADLYIVAFSDPNDLLTYELTTPADRTTINVRVSNANTWFRLFENPERAHRGYLDNRQVWKLISCGYPDGCLKSR